ncbi:hypothetical protein SynSYN20_01125 [Synechococcus sp. SYN20]|uniref:hypothetical protein n=1 Tax=Synechococcus sp. SYN20 TaxID=1050714 RepID=UPI001646A719|nr:hypothetical protein [Synechococcus sp. SYN20]QNJ25462.1 hypothetical protein SynSYN20_01125 [Synechococcus sp. SYN20]
MPRRHLLWISLGLMLSQAIAWSSAQAQTDQTSEQDMRRGLVGHSAYAACKMLHADYSKERADLIVEAAIKNNNWESQKNWLKSSQATQTIKLVSEAMNKECTDFNQNSTQFVPAMEAIETL